MMKRTIAKRLALAGLLLVVLLGISGCFTKPDKVETLPTDPVQVLPFETATPTPSPGPTDQSGWEEGWATDAPVSIITAGPVITPTIGIITASPTPVPAATPVPTAKPTEDSTLRNGSSGQAVRNLQQRLKELGYYTGSVDGDFGKGTENALKDFQKANGLTADGIAGSRTLSAINSSSAKAKAKATTSGAYATSRPAMKEYTPSTPGTYRYLQLGSSGSDVTKLQNRLKELGYYKGTVNGSFGVDTEAAVIAFQERNGEWVDGVAGQDTQEAIYSPAALPAARGGSNTVPSTGYRILKNGDSGEDVTALQARLDELGYYEGKADGSYGRTTASAVESFQSNNNLAADGVASVGTQVRLYSENVLYAPVDTVTLTKAVLAALEPGSMGDEVYRLQERLYDLGYYTGRIDGIYSDAVTDAVRAFQRTNGLSANGKASKETLAKLYGEKAVAAKEGGDDTYTTLKQGDEGERVRALQGLLNTYGYFADAVNGTYGASTTAAVTALQAQNGLMPDGVAGPATQQLLYEGSPIYAPSELNAPQGPAPTPSYATLAQGSTGADVSMMQQFLAEQGYYIGDELGTYGATTLLAVQDFQERNGLTADGVAGHETLALIFSGTGTPSEAYGMMAAETTQRTSMQQGDEGQDVFTMQERLWTLGYLYDSPDGKYGRSTMEAVKAFQARNGLSADGVAGEKTVTAMYASGAVPVASIAAQVENLEVVSNRNREIEEQNKTGAIQASLAGGGIAASYNSTVYYAGKGGTLYLKNGNGDRQIYDGAAKYIHASDKGVTFLSGNKILRINPGNSTPETLVTDGGIKKLAVIGGTLLYQDGSSLVKAGTKADPQIIAKDINDFSLDVFQYTVLIASKTGLKSIGMHGGNEELIVSGNVDQVQICNGTIFYRSGGDIFRIENGVSVRILQADASWMAVYREKVYFISDKNLYCSDTNGKNSEIFWEGPVAEVSFVAGRAYIAEKSGGPVTQILETGEEVIE